MKKLFVMINDTTEADENYFDNKMMASQVDTNPDSSVMLYRIESCFLSDNRIAVG